MTDIVMRADPTREYFFEEGCYINEMLNHAAHAELSIAQARVPAGQSTRWHRLRHSAERYVILEGSGWVEVGDSPRIAIAPGDVVNIPVDVAQRVHCAAACELVFLAICTPRFQPQNYELLDDR